jgi:ribosome-binding factor A
MTGRMEELLARTRKREQKRTPSEPVPGAPPKS